MAKAQYWLGEGTLIGVKGVKIKTGGMIPEGSLSKERIRHLGSLIGEVPQSVSVVSDSKALVAENEELKAGVAARESVISTQTEALTALAEENEALKAENLALKADNDSLSAYIAEVGKRSVDQSAKTPAKTKGE